MRINNKGFTLVELLAVIVILLAISVIAIPNITASLERNKNKMSESQKKLIASSAELYISENKNTITYYSSFVAGTCCLSINTLESMGYLSSDDLKDANGNVISGYINYINNKYEFVTSCTNPCS